MRRLTALLMLLCATGALAACGGGDDGDGPSKTVEPSATLTECLENAGLEVETRDGGVVRATDPESDATADITTFATGVEANEFANQLPAPPTQAGKRVAVYSSGENPTQTEVDKCIASAE